MKNLASLFVFAIFAISLVTPHIAEAAGPGVYYVRMTPSAGSATANGSSVITVNLFSYVYRCNSGLGGSAEYCNGQQGGIAGEMGIPSEDILIIASGSGNSLSSTTPVTDAAGNGSFTISSTVAEAKTIQAVEEYSPSYVFATISVDFVAPAPVAAAPSASPTPQRAANPAPTVAPPAEPAPPAAPITEIKVGGKVIAATDKPTIKDNESLVVSGKTVPNGVITIYVFSEPKKYTTTADKDGNWTYKVSGLPPGDHHIEAEATDPTTGKTSSRTQVLSFSVEKFVETVAAASLSSKQQPSVPESGSMFALFGMMTGGILLVMALAVIYVWKFQRGTFDSALRRLHMKNGNISPPRAY